MLVKMACVIMHTDGGADMIPQLVHEHSNTKDNCTIRYASDRE